MKTSEIRNIPGPDPNPVKPRFALPPGACDTHCHIFGPADRFPYSAGRSYTPPDSPRENLRALHDFLGFSRAVLVQASCHGEDNRAMLDAIAWAHGRWRGVAMVGGQVTASELAELYSAGVRGVRFNFVRHLGGAPDLAVFERTLSMLGPLGMHVVLHFDAEDIETYAGHLRRIAVPFVIDHMGRVDAKRGLEQRPFRMLLELMKNELAWVKVCGPERVSCTGSPYHDAVPFAQALIEAAPDRILWGTDFPHPNVKVMPNDGELVDLFPMFTADATQRRKILVDNPARLYWAGEDSGSD
jgi:predicted TIM-barrel fold metal-dependent hydrolase